MTPRAETDRAHRLTLRLRWHFEELPVLLDLPEEVLVSWRAGDDPKAGVPMRVRGWRFEAGRVRLSLLLSDAVGAAPVEPPR